MMRKNIIRRKKTHLNIIINMMIRSKKAKEVMQDSKYFSLYWKEKLYGTWTRLNYRRNLGHTYHLVKMRTGHPADIQTVPEAVWSFTVN